MTWHRGGFFGAFDAHGGFHAFLEPVFATAAAIGTGHEGAAAHAAGGYWASYWLMYVSSALALGGIATAWFFYRRRPTIPGAIALWAAPVYRLLYNKYYVDEAYDAVFVRPLRRFGDVCHGVDRYVINTLLWLIAAVPRAIGFGLKSWQQGAMQGYALGMAIGLFMMILWVLIRSAT